MKSMHIVLIFFRLIPAVAIEIPLFAHTATRRKSVENYQKGFWNLKIPPINGDLLTTMSYSGQTLTNTAKLCGTVSPLKVMQGTGKYVVDVKITSNSFKSKLKTYLVNIAFN